MITEEKLLLNDDTSVQETNVQLKRNIAIKVRNSLQKTSELLDDYFNHYYDMNEEAIPLTAFQN